MTAQALFTKEPLYRSYVSVNLVQDESIPIEKTEAEWQVVQPASMGPVRFLFRGSDVEWPVSLESSLGDEFASIRSAAPAAPTVLGMPFISKQKAVIFDFTKGKERIGFISMHEIKMDPVKGTRLRERIIQLIVGASLGFGMVGGWKWYEGSLF
jgi:hypothetical protein